MSAEILDLDALKRNFADDLAFAGRLAAKFETRYPGLLKVVTDALARGDGTAAAEAAHRLAGETSVFYAKAARVAALDVEDLARAGDLDGARAGCATLSAELDRLATTLRELAAAS
jgi:HPt (histidine-containing phosphotransfer) domain-containing protein